MNRRAFLSWVGVGGIASSLPIALAACSPDKNRESKAPPPPGFHPVGKAADLTKNGQILNKESVFGPVLVIRDTADKLTAVNLTCTHKGCLVDWKADQKLFACPCHKAKFALDGSVKEGPASQPLQTYQAKIEGDSVLVSS